LPAGSVIPAGGFSLLVADRANFALAYGQTIPVLAEFPGTLDNGGESIALVKPLGQGGTNDLIISDVRYSNVLPWPTNANGFGPSLQLIDPSKGSYRVANWATTASNTDPNRVTPGRANSVKATIAAFPTLWINEVLPNSLTGPLDNAGEREPFIEIYNSGTATVSLNGLYLSDDYSNLQKWAFPSTATLGAKQFLLVWADGQTGQSTASAFHTSFRLNPTNGSVALSRVQTAAVAIDYIDYARIAPDHSIGSYPDGEPRNRRLFSNVTGGAANDPTFPTANIVINEYMAANTTTVVDPATSNFEDWFELYNAGSNDIDLTSYKLTSILTNSTQFQIPSGYVLPAGGFLLVWADNMSKSNQVSDTSLHVSFKLNKLGGDIGLFDPTGKLIDGFTYGEQTNDVSMGHFPDGDTGLQVTFDAPTPGGPNTLSGANQPPVLNAISDQTVTEQTLLQLTAHATDPDSGQTIEYSLGVGSPAGAAINPTTGVFTWTPSEQQGPGSYQVTVLATDNGTPARTALVRFNVTVNESNQAPALDPISNATIPDSTLFAFTATATDADVPTNSLNFSLGAGAPAGTAIDPVTGRFTWTPAPAQAGNYNITIVVTDNGSPAKSDQKTFSLTVNVVEHAPVIDQVSQQFVNEGTPFQLQIHATDPNSPPSAITYSLEGVGLPSGLVIDPSTGVMTWTPTEAQGPSNYGVNVRATKNSGAHLSSTITFSITVNEVNQAPVLGSIQNIQVEEGGFASLQISAVDADLPKQNLTYSLLPGAPAGASIDTVSGLFTWQTPLDGAALTNQIFVVVTDDGPGALSNTNSFFVTLIPRFRAIINEIMYHPTLANAEYVELINPSTVRTQDLTGVILGGPRMNYAFTSGTKLLPGQIITIAQNTTAFHTAFGAGLAVAGQWTGSFDRTDAWVRLYSVDAQNHTNVLDQVNFEPNAPWNTAADDGAGSLQVIDPLVDNSRVGNWTAVPANPGPQWQHVIQTGTASSSTLYLYLETVGEVYLDDVVLVAGDVAEVGQNFVADGDFESALTGPWVVSPNLSTSSLDTSIKHSGASSLHMVTTAGGTTRASAIYQDLATALTSGANYTLSYWYLPNTNGGTLTLRLSGSG
ncbi:MAG: lamin tail domain-containing protein, partial [Limisphaerales bacterium]